MKYLLLLYSAPESRPDPGSDMPRWFAVTEEMGKAGVLVAGDALQGTDTATTLREGMMSDGPFAETKETLGGYYLIDVPDLDAAAEWAKKLPIADYGSVEIRPVQEFDR
jgi:hypothetical protein